MSSLLEDLSHVGILIDRLNVQGRGKDPFARLLEGLDTETLDPAVKDIVKQTKNLLQELRSGVDRSLEAWKGTVSMVEAALTAGT